MQVLLDRDLAELHEVPVKVLNQIILVFMNHITRGDNLKMTEQIIQDCVKFKHDLQDKLQKDSGTKDIREYVKYVRELSQKPSLYKNSPQENNGLKMNKGEEFFIKDCVHYKYDLYKK